MDREITKADMDTEIANTFGFKPSTKRPTVIETLVSLHIYVSNINLIFLLGWLFYPKIRPLITI